MVLWNKQSEWLKILSVSWSKRSNCQLSSEFKQQRSMSTFTIVQLLNLSSMINQLLQRKHSLNWSHSLITFTCENTNAMSMLTPDHYLLKIDRISLWIVKEWECSWDTSMKSQSSTGCEPQISSASSKVMLLSLLRMKRKKMWIKDSQDRHLTLFLSESQLNDHTRRTSQFFYLHLQRHQHQWTLNLQIQTHGFKMHLQSTAAKKSACQIRQLQSICLSTLQVNSLTVSSKWSSSSYRLRFSSWANLSAVSSKWSSSFYRLRFSREDRRMITQT